MNIYKLKNVEQHAIIGRECDNCHFMEIDDRMSIEFDHVTDEKWAKVQLHTTYTIPDNNRHYHLCSPKCLKEFAARFAEIYIPIQSSSDLSGIPLRWFEDLTQE